MSSPPAPTEIERARGRLADTVFVVRRIRDDPAGRCGRKVRVIVRRARQARAAAGATLEPACS